MNIHNIIKLAYAIKREFNQQLEQYELTFNQWLILKELNLNGSLSAQELTGNLNSDKATMSQCLKALETKGFIARESNPLDKRSKLIVIQSEARVHCEQIKIIEQEFKQRLNGEYNEDNLFQFNKICEQSLAALEGE